MADKLIRRRGSRFKDHAGEVFGRLLVLEEDQAKRGAGGSVYWKCLCECGTQKSIDAGALRSGQTVSCGCYHREERSGPKRRDLAGQRFGKLTVLSYAGSTAKRRSKWNCQCDCGNTASIRTECLLNGHTRSCGCLHRRANGEAANGRQTPEYTAWAGMIRRCEGKDKKSHDYKGRGIKVCQRWRSSYHAFLSDMGRRPSALHSLDRINNDGDYEPGNVRWTTADVQQANRRKPVRRSWREAAKHAYSVVRDFEDVIASYCGAPYAVSMDSCTAALHLVCKYLRVGEVEIPRFTYCGVPMSVINAGGTVKFRDEAWVGSYRLDPYPVYDCARHMTSAMYKPGTFMCLSFHWAKHLPIGRGGAVLCDSEDAYEWLKKARFDGRSEGVPPAEDMGMVVGSHYYFTPPQAAQGLMLMASMKEHNDPIPADGYPDLSKLPIFGNSAQKAIAEAAE